MVKRVLLLLTILLVALFPTQAQDDCEIDLLDEIAQLAEAQRAADTGDTTAAAQTITEVQAQLATQLETCTPGNGLLPATFEFPDGLFRFSYPADWAVLSPVAGVYALGNSQTVVNSLVETNFEDALPAGTQILVAAYGDKQSVFNVDSFADFQKQIQEDGMGDTLHLTVPKDVVMNDYQGIEFTVTSDLFAGRAYALDLRASKIAFFLAITPRGEFEAFEPT